MNLELVTTKKLKKQIEQKIKNEDYINYANSKEDYINYVQYQPNINEFLLKHPQEHFKMSFLLYNVDDLEALIDKVQRQSSNSSQNLYIAIYQKLIKKFQSFLGQDIYPKQYYQNQNHYYDALVNYLDEQSYALKDTLRIFPILFNEQTQQNYIFYLNESNAEFLTQWFQQHFIAFTNQIKFFENYFTDINYLIFAQDSDSNQNKFELIKLSRHDNSDIFKYSYISTFMSNFFKKFLSEESLNILSHLKITHSGINFISQEKEQTQLLNYKTYIEDRDSMYVKNDFFIKEDMKLSLTVIKKNLIQCLNNPNNSSYIASIFLNVNILKHLPQVNKVIAKYWNHVIKIKPKKNETVYKNNKHSLNTKIFSKQLAQADIEEHYYFEKTNPSLSNTDTTSLSVTPTIKNFALYSKDKITINATHKIQQDFEHDYIRADELDIFTEEYLPSEFQYFYASLWNQNIIISNSYVSSHDNKYWLLYVPNNLTDKIVQIAKSTIHNSFKYSVFTFNQNIDILIINLSWDSIVIPFMTIYSALNKDIDLNITIKLPHKIIYDKKNTINIYKWFPTSSIGLQNRHSAINMSFSLAHNNADFSTSDFFTSDVFKKELLSLSNKEQN